MQQPAAESPAMPDALISEAVWVAERAAAAVRTREPADG
jgi:hypothetical protein